MLRTKGGKGGIFEHELGKLGGADCEGPNADCVGAHLTGSALKARPCHVHPSVPSTWLVLVGLWTD